MLHRYFNEHIILFAFKIHDGRIKCFFGLIEVLDEFLDTSLVMESLLLLFSFSGIYKSDP